MPFTVLSRKTGLRLPPTKYRAVTEPIDVAINLAQAIAEVTT